MEVSEVQRQCTKFFEEMFGMADQSPATDRGLRLVSLGNAEKTIQGELLCYLARVNTNSGSSVVSECGASLPAGGGRLTPDITVFDFQWHPTCIIELKHYSANQGLAAVLRNNMTADRGRYSGDGVLANVPVILIGLYTEIQQRDDLINEYGLYRFLRTYYNGTPNPQRFTSAPKEIVQPKAMNFSIGNCGVNMRVGYCIISD